MIDTKENSTIEVLIGFAAAGARGASIQIENPNWKEILQVANEQHILPLLACAVINSPELVCPDQLREHLLNTMRTSASINMIRRQRIMYLIHEMKAAGIHVRLLK